tara:strand:+ start:114 stop:641 length:528 start_codon:yes stop_codon:yes gene_type:complete
MADPIWLQKLKRALSGGSTPSYDIDITHQYGKPHRGRLNKPEVQEKFGPSGPHPGIESGYQGGLTRARKDWDIEKTYPLKGTNLSWGEGEGPNKIPTQMAGKKGLSMKNMIKALTEMKKPADLKAPSAKLMGEARPQLPGPPPFAPLGGVNQSIMNTGGLPGDRNKKWWEIMGYS